METGRPVRRLLQVVPGEGNDGDHIGVTGLAWGCGEAGRQEMFWRSKHQDLRGWRQREKREVKADSWVSGLGAGEGRATLRRAAREEEQASGGVQFGACCI